MAAVAPDLRPRGPAELYDAALHLCVRGQTPLPALAFVGAVLPALSGLALAHQAIAGRPFFLQAALFAFCLMARGVFLGAASLAAESCLEGAPLSAWGALRRALGHGVSLGAAGGLLVLLEWFLIPASLFVGLAFWAPLYSAPALVARGDAGPWGMGRVCRQRLGREPTFVVRVLHGIAFGVVLINVGSGIAMGLYLARALLALDVSFLSQFASPKNPEYLLFLVATSMVLLEPVKAALGLLLLVDARVRAEGLDLRAAVDRLAAKRAARGGPAAAALVGLLVLGAPAAVSAADPQVEADLVELLEEAGLSDDAAALQGVEAARELEGPDAVALRHFVDRLRQAWDAGESSAVVKARLREGLEQIHAARQGHAPALDPQATARQILSQPEFEAPPEKAAAEKEEKEEDGWLMRLLKWLFERDAKPERKSSFDWNLGGLGAGVFRVLTFVLLGVVLALVAFFVGRALLRRREQQDEEGEAGAAAGGAAAGPAQESALDKAPRGWWSDADALAARGEFRAAMRALYLAVLSALHRRGAIEYDPTRSNWDYVKAFRGGGEELPPFRDLTRRFDFAWYGRLGADAEGYGTARGLAAPFLQREGDVDA